MNLPTLSPIKNIALLIALAITGLALAGCGNKGPLVRPSDIPAPAPAASTVPAVDESAAEPITEPDATPVADPATGTPAAQR